MLATGCAAVNLCHGASPDRSNELDFGQMRFFYAILGTPLVFLYRIAYLFAYTKYMHTFMFVYTKQVVKLLIYDFLFFKTSYVQKKEELCRKHLICHRYGNKH